MIDKENRSAQDSQQEPQEDSGLQTPQPDQPIETPRPVPENVPIENPEQSDTEE